MGTIIFNLFVNDIFSVIQEGQLYNYADDNSVQVEARQKDVVKKLKDNAGIIVKWGSENQMAANPAKFQVMIGKEKSSSQIELDDITSISSESQVRLLRIYPDNFMNFNYHVTHLLQKVRRQLNCPEHTAYPLKSDLQLLLYKLLVYSNFNYCPVAPLWPNKYKKAWKAAISCVKICLQRLCLRLWIASKKSLNAYA